MDEDLDPKEKELEDDDGFDIKPGGKKKSKADGDDDFGGDFPEDESLEALAEEEDMLDNDSFDDQDEW